MNTDSEIEDPRRRVLKPRGVREWNRLASRLQALLDISRGELAGREPLVTTIAKRVTRWLRRLSTFIEQFGQRLSGAKYRRLFERRRRILATLGEILRGNKTSLSKWKSVQVQLRILNHLLRNLFDGSDASKSSLIDRALDDLQRSIVDENGVRDPWKDAYHTGKRACEKRGASYLLKHGIWSFNVTSDQTRADLIAGDPLRKNDERLKPVDVVALTEWETSPSRIGRAIEQTRAYHPDGSIDAELEATKYIIVVTESALSNDIEEDKCLEDQIYRIRHVSVDPF